MRTFFKKLQSRTGCLGLWAMVGFGAGGISSLNNVIRTLSQPSDAVDMQRVSTSPSDVIGGSLLLVAAIGLIYFTVGYKPLHGLVDGRFTLAWLLMFLAGAGRYLLPALFPLTHRTMTLITGPLYGVGALFFVGLLLQTNLKSDIQLSQPDQPKKEQFNNAN